MSSRFERIRKAMFTLAPLAFAAAAWLMPRVDPTARLGLAFDRQGAAQIAVRELAERGLDVEAQEARLKVEVDDGLERYLRLRQAEAPDAVAQVYRLAPPFQVRVAFPDEEGWKEPEVRLAAEGRSVGVAALPRRDAAKEDAESPEIGPAAAERNFLEEWLGPEAAQGLQLVEPPRAAPEGDGKGTGSEEAGPETASRGSGEADDAKGSTSMPEVGAPPGVPQGFTFSKGGEEEGWEEEPGVRTWVVGLEGLDELTLTARTLARDGEVVAWRFAGVVETDFREQRLQRGKASLALRVTSAILLFLASGIMLFWGLWRYWLRFQESEVSHGRTFLLALTVAVLTGGALFYLLESSSLVSQLDGEFTSGLLALVVITATTAASVLPLGLLLGAVWSGCEGDVRAIFPDRLRSLDALLAGRWLSSNPAASFLAGAAGAAWVVLAQLVLWLPWVSRPEWGPDLGARHLLFAHPFQAGIAVALAVLVPYSALGLMAPLSLLRRWTASRWRTLPVLGIFLWLVCLQLPQVVQRLPAASGVASAAVWAAAFLVPFFVFDLVAAFWTFLLAHLGLLILLFLHQPAAALRHPTLVVGGGIAVLLALAALVRRFGQEVSDVEVRPGYARNILERLSLSAELGAAQQARARMLPAQFPTLPGARLSACSSSAEGDYYDYFPRPDGSVALAAADFGRHGLAAALRVTLAKGFLLSYSDRALAPAEASARLKSRLAELVYDPEEISLVYGVFDPERRSLELVSDLGGVWVLIRRTDGGLQEVLATNAGARARQADSATSLELFEGDTVVFLVVGSDQSPRDRNRALQALRRHPWQDAQAVLRLLRKRGSSIGTVLHLQLTEEAP